MGGMRAGKGRMRAGKGRNAGGLGAECGRARSGMWAGMGQVRPGRT